MRLTSTWPMALLLHFRTSRANDAISVSLRNILVLWIILYGLAIWRGLVKTPVQDIAGYKAIQYISRGGKLAGRGIRSGATKGWSAVKSRFSRRTVAPKP